MFVSLCNSFFGSQFLDGLQEFREVTQNIKNVGALLAKVQMAEVDRLVEALHDGTWGASIFENEEFFPLAALKALEERQISIAQFSTVLFFYSIRLHFPRDAIEVYSLDNEVMASKVIETFAAPNERVESVQHHFAGEGRFYLANTEIAEWKEIVLNLSKDQQTFFVIPSLQQRFENNQGFLEAKKGSLTISESIYFDSLVNIFNNISLNGKRCRMVPSFGMIEAFHQVYAKDMRVKLTPIIGLSSVERIRNNGLTKTRDVGLEFPGYPLPRVADEFLCPHGFEFGAFHDALYHGMIASSVPEKHQRAFVHLYDITREIDQEIHSKILDVFAERLIDMEHGSYGKEFRYLFDAKKFESEEDLESYMFWNGVSSQLINTGNRLAIKECRKCFDKGINMDDKAFGSSMEKEIERVFEQSDFFGKLAKKSVQDSALREMMNLFETLKTKSKEEKSMYEVLLKDFDAMNLFETLKTKSKEEKSMYGVLLKDFDARIREGRQKRGLFLNIFNEFCKVSNVSLTQAGDSL